MNLKGVRESKNYDDNTNPSLANRFLSHVLATYQYYTDPKVRHQVDEYNKANQEAPLQPMNVQENMNTTVKRVNAQPGSSAGGYEIRRPGSTFSEFAPDVVPVDPGIVSGVHELLRRQGIQPRRQ